MVWNYENVHFLGRILIFVVKFCFTGNFISSYDYSSTTPFNIFLKIIKFS